MGQVKFIVRTYGDRVGMVKKDIAPYISNLIICEDKTPRDILKNNAHFNFEKSLKLAGESACVHIEDDVELCDDFYNKVLNIISERPNEVIQFFSMRKDDLTVGSRYMTGGSFSMNQCYYLPANMSKDMLAFNSEWKLKNPEKFFNSPYDIMMADYFKDRKIKYWLHIPNLVNHKEIVSAIDSRRSKKRVSKTFKK